MCKALIQLIQLIYKYIYIQYKWLLYKAERLWKTSKIVLHVLCFTSFVACFSKIATNKVSIIICCFFGKQEFHHLETIWRPFGGRCGNKFWDQKGSVSKQPWPPPTVPSPQMLLIGSEGKRWKRRLKICEIIPTYSNEQNVGAHLRGSTNFQEFWITKIDYQNMWKIAHHPKDHSC